MEDYIPLTCQLTNWKPYTPQCVKMLLYITCVKEKMNNLANNIENQIREDFKLKYYKLSEQEIEEKVRGVKVKGYLSGDREKYLSDKAEFIVA